MVRRFAEYFIVAWFSLPVTLLAQGAPGSIQGIVCEIQTCKPIDGVQVSLVRPGSKEPVKTMRADVSGEFGFFDLQPGMFPCRISQIATGHRLLRLVRKLLDRA